MRHALSGHGGRRLTALVAALLGLAIAPGLVAAGGAPIHVGPIDQTYSFLGMTCDGFDIWIDGAGSDDFTIWRDGDGNVASILYRARYPHDTLTNQETGAAIVVRGEFEERLVRIAGTDEFTKTITGFRYLVNQPGAGVTIRDVGRIQYGDLEQTIVLWEAGVHDLALDAEIDAAFCAALG